MARGLKWTMTFKSYEERTCQVNIYAEGYEGEVTTLTGATNPFVFEEDDTDNLLDVIRVKTGFLRVIEQNYGDLTDLHPLTNTAHYITVTYNGTTVFSGFMQAQSFETAYEPGPRVLEFPVMSPLGAVAGLHMPQPANPSYITLAAALKMAAETIDAGITSIVFPDYMMSDSERTLALRVNTLNFCPFNDGYDSAANADTPLYKPVTVGEFIEDICNCFGLIVHDMPGMLVFARYDYDGTYNQYQVSTMAAATPTFSQPTSGATAQDLTSLTPKGHDNMEKTVLPVRRVDINYDDDYFPDYELPFFHCKTKYSQIGEVIMEPMTDEITSSYLKTNAMPTPGVAGVTVGAYGDLDMFGSLEEMVIFAFPSSAAASTQIFKWKLYQVPKYFGYGCVLSFRMVVINRTTHEVNDAAEGHKVGIIMKNGNYYRQADGTWIITSGQYIDEQETDENGEIKIEYHQRMPDIGSPLEVIVCAGDFRGDLALNGIKDMKFSRTVETFYQYHRTPSNTRTIESDNGSNSDASLSQNITVARPSEGALITSGGSTYSNEACDYGYMFATQHLLTLDTYVLPNVMHYMKKITIGNSVKKRIVGFGFDLWNDIVTITAQGGSTL